VVRAGLAAYRALATTQLVIVPRLLACCTDPEIYPLPFWAVTRLRGEVPAEPEVLIEQLGQAIACWHELAPPALAGARHPRHHDAAHHRWLRRALDPSTSAGAAAEAADLLGRPGRAPVWADLLASAAQLPRVLVHGDIHDGQLLADGDRLTGIIDWKPARVDHPFWDFDLGQWGTGLWRRRPDLSGLWARGWHAYAQARARRRLRPAGDRLSPPARASSARRSRRSRCRWHDRRAPGASVADRRPYCSIAIERTASALT
jgi:aminoglycoside phosphotransferase (APT) family kinase protein